MTARDWPGTRGLQFEEPVVFELHGDADQGLTLDDVPDDLRGLELRTEPTGMRDVPEYRIVRHYTRISQWNYGIESGFFPLGSCTMKHNPRVNEDMANLSGFAWLHPEAPQAWAQGAIEALVTLQDWLSGILGMADFTLQPCAGAHGEFAGLAMIRAYFQDRGEDHVRRKILIPETAHGTNPASAALAGFEVVNLPPQAGAVMRPEDIAPHLGPDVAALMLTNPNTLGVFEPHILEIAKLVDASGALLYCDGANTNAIMGQAKPGDFGVDVIQLNLHKTFSTPHGGGGPGGGAVGVSERLRPYLPGPHPVRRPDGTYALDADRPKSIGPVKSFYGHFGISVRALAYIMRLGRTGLAEASRRAVLNANYIRHQLQGTYDLPFDDASLHEVVFSDKRQKALGVSALDIAKGLIDRGFHPPTIYFPLVVSGALMIEPTETEDKPTLDLFIEAMREIAELAEAGRADELTAAPVNPIRKRLDEAQAARNPRLRWQAATA
jgi:glycine dehydrogenase subunit 2